MSNKKRIKPFKSKRDVTMADGKTCTILVYGELSESNLVEGFQLNGVQMTRKGRVIRNEPIEIVRWVEVGTTHAPVKRFNMGWSICDSRDKFNMQEGIRIAKKRFAQSPMKTQSGNFLTEDMCQSIVNNEAKYMERHIDKFINVFKKK